MHKEFSEEDRRIIEVVEKTIPSLNIEFFPIKIADTNIFEILETAQKNQINVKFHGPTGSGKTTIFEAYCQETNQPHFISNMKGSTTSEELIGAYVPNDNENDRRNFVWKDGIIIRAIKYSNLWEPCEVKITDKLEYSCKKGRILDIKNEKIVEEDILEKNNSTMIVKQWPMCMLTIEEINFSPEELMSVWFSLLDIRRNIVLNEKDGETLKAGKFLSINATMNPDYIGTNQLNQALNDRFLIKIPIEYDNKVENKIINKKSKLYGFSSEEIDSFKKFIHLIRKGFKQRECQGNISTRMIEAFLDIKGKFSEDLAMISLINSFTEEDQEAIKSFYNIVKSSSDTIQISTEEMEGLDLQNFKGYTKTLEQTIKKVDSSAKAPW